MEPGELKPILTALVLPPAGPLLLATAGCALVAWRRRKAGVALAFAGIALLWLLSCHAVAMRLSDTLLPPVQPATPRQLQSVQAIVVLGGGADPLDQAGGQLLGADLLLGRQAGLGQQFAHMFSFVAQPGRRDRGAQRGRFRRQFGRDDAAREMPRSLICKGLRVIRHGCQSARGSPIV